VNFYGVVNGCRLALPDMVKRRRGHIVNIASMAGMLAVPGQALYAGTKFAPFPCPRPSPPRACVSAR
jgi:NADP-dependent 3-hydroxy acid dehydrogenase YdfG